MPPLTNAEKQAAWRRRRDSELTKLRAKVRKLEAALAKANAALTETAPAKPSAAAQLQTMTPDAVRRLLVETLVGVQNGTISAAEARKINRDCAGITRELNRRIAAAARLVRFSRGPKPKK